MWGCRESGWMCGVNFRCGCNLPCAKRISLLRRPPAGTRKHRITSGDRRVLGRRSLPPPWDRRLLFFPGSPSGWPRAKRAPMATALDQVRALIRDVPDFPQPGILFKDLTPVLGDPAAFRAVIDELSARLRGKGFHRIVAIEARGFLLGPPLPHRLRLALARIP